MKSLKLKNNQWKDVADCCDVILVNAERLVSAEAFKPEQVGYIICIFEDTSDYRFHI